MRSASGRTIGRALRLVSACFGLALIACGAPAPPAATPAGQTTAAAQTLRILNSFTIDSLDPAQAGQQWMPTFGVAELLMQVDERGQLKPWVLESIERQTDTRWHLRLRKGVTFQNGKPVDAVAVAAAMRRQLDKFPAASALLPGASVESSGDLDLTLNLPSPDATVPAKLAEFNGFPVYDVTAVEAAGSDLSKLAGSGLYTGPFAIAAWTRENLELKRYDGYWQGKPKLAGITVRVVLDPQARVAAVQSGEADLTLYPPTDAKRALAGRADAFYVTATEGLESLRLEMNERQSPFDELSVRRAFGLAIDYQTLATNVMDRTYDTATGMFPASYPGAISNQRTEPEQANQLLEAAGWRAGTDGVRSKNGQRLGVTLLTYPQQPDTSSHAVAIQDQVRKVGFDVSIGQSEDITSVLKKDTGWNAALIFNGTISPWSAAPEASMLRYLGSGSPDNYAGVRDPELDGLMRSLVGTFDQTRRQALLREIQEVVIDQRAYLAIASFKRFPMVVSPAYRGYVPSNYRRFVTFDLGPTTAH